MEDTDLLLCPRPHHKASSSGRRGSYAPLTDSKRPSILRSEGPRPAEPWPCRPCGLLLGCAQLFLGLTLVIYDVATNQISETAFAISSGVCYIVTGLLALIASRRLDRATVLLLLIFALTSLALSVTLFVESVAVVNYKCHYEKECRSQKTLIHAVLLCLTLLEGSAAAASVVVSAQSLRRRRMRHPASPFAQLLIPDTGPPADEQPSRAVIFDTVRSSSETNERVLYEYLVK